MQTSYFLGSDIGTGSCKTVLVDYNGRQVGSASSEYACAYPHPDWVEQNPEDWYRAFCASVMEVISKAQIDPAEIQAITIVGITHNPVLLDVSGSVLRPAIHFWDQRSRSQVAAISRRFGNEVIRRAYNAVDVLWTWPQLEWVRNHEPEVWAKIDRLLFPKDYVRHRLAGSPVTDEVDPAGTLLYDPVSKGWIQPFIDDLDFPPHALPSIQPAADPAGQVTDQGAADAGLKVGTPVFTGTTDTAAETLGSGGVGVGHGIVKLASVGRLMVVTDRPLPGGRSLNYPHVIDGLWYPGSVTKYGAAAYSWIRQMCWAELEDKDAFKILDAAADEITPGSEGVYFHPHLLGEYAPQWNPELRGSFTGLSIQHDRRHLTRSVLEGVAFQILAAFDQLQENGAKLDEIRLIGGGAKSRLWAKILANVLDRPLGVPAYQSAAYGAALLTGIGCGVFSDAPDEIRRIPPLVSEIEPEKNLAERYKEFYFRYQKIGSYLEEISKIAKGE